MLTVHHLGVSQSDRVVWLCEELELDYELKVYKRLPEGLGPPEYKALHPLGTAPIITDGELVMPETGAIFQYIMGKHGPRGLAAEPGDPDFADYLFWFHFANGSLMPGEMSALLTARMGLDADNPAVKFRKARSDNAFALVEDRLGRSPYFAGHRFTAADIMMHFPLAVMRRFSRRSLGDSPNTRAWLARVEARPAFQRARAKGDPDLPALPD